MAINDVHKFGAMFESVEVVSNIIIRYTILEKQYFQSNAKRHMDSDTELWQNLEKAIVGLYTAILGHLYEANRYFQQNKASGCITLLLLHFSTTDFKRTRSTECSAACG